MQLVYRTGWGAPATSAASYIASTRGVKVHWLGTAYSSRKHSSCDDYVRKIRASHLAHPTERYVDIAYNFAVCEHGTVFEGRGLHKRTGANGTAALNSRHYAVVALHGTTSGAPSSPLLSGLRDTIEHCQKRGDAGGEILGHRDGYATQCPGAHLYAWVQSGAPRPGRTADTYTVKAGDTLTSIAGRYATTGAAIAELNALADPDRISVGQRLRLPAPQPPPARPVVDLSRLQTAARSDPPASGQPVTYPEVRVVEDALVAEGLLESRYADGHFGTATVVAYSVWQQQLGYHGTQPGGAADGIPGKTSLTRLGQRNGFDVKE